MILSLVVIIVAALIGASIGHIVASVFIMKTPPFGLPWKKGEPLVSPLAAATATGKADLRQINAQRLRDKPVDEDSMLSFEDGWTVVDSDEGGDEGWA